MQCWDTRSRMCLLSDYIAGRVSSRGRFNTRQCVETSSAFTWEPTLYELEQTKKKILKSIE